MKVLIATDGQLDPVAAAESAARLCGDDGSVTVLTVIEIPRRLLSDLRAVYGEPSNSPPVDQSLEYAGHPTARPHLGFDWPGDDALLERYIDDQKTQRTGALVTALADRNITAEVLAAEHESPVTVILDQARERNIDVICVGTHGQGMFEGLLGSTTTKVIRRAHCAVLTIRS